MWENVLYSSIVLIVIIIATIGIVYLFNFRNMKKQKKYYKSLHENLRVGKKVLFLNAIYGEIAAINKETVDIKVKSGQIMEVSRYAISKILN
ncbi:preprotein translocase subunit YajC [Vagococcus elongatus]|uniref:Preprotein translocase subunit YajC n=1 Tax=Vagococcus elongatus TaxID=180344 RepID=A0A430AY58_9ENTE|nr:preprotein translocase subunit YajC [Vagococcus elongatus]RSU13002.1 preprotein translocase subunit YajC [Vagococcus elongatus]